MILTLDDITHLPDQHGWFYGIVRSEKGTRIYEVFPGIGYGPIGRFRNPKVLGWLIRDVVKQLKANGVPRLSDAEYEDRERRKKQEIRDAKPW